MDEGINSMVETIRELEAENEKLKFRLSNVSGSFLADFLDELPENRPLYKDSGLWQQRSDDMEDVYYQQKANEKTEDFIKRLFEARNDH